MLADPSLCPRTNSFRRTEPDPSVDVWLWHKADFRERPAVMSAFGGNADMGRRTALIIFAAFDPKRT
jgi:hypothetical protein